MLSLAHTCRPISVLPSMVAPAPPTAKTTPDMPAGFAQPQPALPSLVASPPMALLSPPASLPISPPREALGPLQNGQTCSSPHVGRGHTNGQKSHLANKAKVLTKSSIKRTQINISRKLGFLQQEADLTEQALHDYRAKFDGVLLPEAISALVALFGLAHDEL
ncbi:hypothetical protein E2562_020019 [Oryza meyeriana var. granulata]|uniref:Uncharacterized protein n=1 Tax=Oryza meyeriana var. granulata TaxID=110450 RepID=A0A6G1FAA5_9ORYZ|nr:hypothetical protein E2562_020019 [Oryza meyeriana var. granulata]